MDDGALPALPADLNIEGARLPAAYETARNALANCSRIDECQDWANKAEALASYARQMNDTALREMTDRIQARAIRRAGELLREIPPGQGARDGKWQDGAVPPLTRTEAATEAGLSERQRKTALRVANVPSDQFEEAVERDVPATVTELAERGTQHREPSTAHLGGRDPYDFYQATRLKGLLSSFNREAADLPLDIALRGLWPAEFIEVRDGIERVAAWLEEAREALDGI